MPDDHLTTLAGLVRHKGWRLRWVYRWRLIIRRRRGVLRQTYQRVTWAMRLLEQIRHGTLTLAQIVNALTRAQIRRQMGPERLLHRLLDKLQVREIINRHCPTRSAVDHGTVAVVLILNRLIEPRPLYQVEPWVAQTSLPQELGIQVAKFNDDRLGRTLDVLGQHGRAIWLEVVSHALSQAGITIRMLFYDLSAFVVHGTYAKSQTIGFGFAHNTPMNKRKGKLGLTAASEGNIPAEHRLWSGGTPDVATVEENLRGLREMLEACGQCLQEVRLIGDRATLNSKLAHTYDEHQVRYLAGLEARTQGHRALLTAAPDAAFQLLAGTRGPDAYWGTSCPVTFEHAGHSVTHRGLVVLSAPMRRAWRKARAAKLRALQHELRALRAKIGQPYYRSVAQVQRSANAILKRTTAGKFMSATAYTDAHGQTCLRWAIERQALLLAMRKDGRYLLVTNDPTLSPQQMLALYRKKDGVEKDFRITKSDLKVSPIYLHKDQRIAGMLLIHMFALLAYTLLERQTRLHGLQLTTRRILALLATLDVIETLCWDGSSSYRLTPVDADQAALLEVLAQVLADLQPPHACQLQLPSGTRLPLALPPPGAARRNAVS